MKKHERILHYITTMLGDQRLSLVNICHLSQEKTIKFSVEFERKHICEIEIDERYDSIPEAVFKIYCNHPIRKVQDLSYEIRINTLPEQPVAWIHGTVAPKRYFPWVRMNLEAAREIVQSFSVQITDSKRLDYVSDLKYNDLFRFTLRDDPRDPYLPDEDWMDEE